MFAWLLPLLAWTVLALLPVFVTAATTLQDLEVEGVDEPLGIDVQQPRFSWKMAGDSERVDSRFTEYVLKRMMVNLVDNALKYGGTPREATQGHAPDASRARRPTS